VNVNYLFTALLGAILLWLFLVRKLRSKPWLEKGVISDDDLVAIPPQRVGLWVFLGVVTSLFLLFIVMYVERAEYADWRPLADPQLLWLNTALLVVGSIALQLARNAAGAGRLNALRANLTAGAVFTVAFLIGQLQAWQEVTAAGHFMATNPADAFFYILTGLHGIHLLGGLLVLARTTLHAWQGPDPEDVEQAARLRVSVQLCSVYWHYLLLLWLVLFYMLSST
jgi:cytochrome c oxidase subunit 3